MFTHYRTQGFIFKKEDRGEADRLFTIYTENFGKLNLLAKSERKIKSKLRAGLELFYLSEIEFIQGKAYKTLTDTALINNFKNLRKDLKRLNIASEVSEVLDKLIKGEESDEKIWELLSETFKRLEVWDSELIYYYFLWNFLSILGYQLDLYNCSLCEKKLIPEKIYFIPKEGGLICSQCEKITKTEKEISLETIKLARVFLEKDLDAIKKLKIEDDDLKKLKEISDYYFSEVLEQIE